MNFNFMIKKISRKFYYAFFYDSVRLYRVMPPKYRFVYWIVFGSHITAGVSEVVGILFLTFFTLSVAAQDAVRNSYFIRAAFREFPNIEAMTADPRVFAACACVVAILAIAFKNFMYFCSLRYTLLFAEKLSAHLGAEIIRRYLNKEYVWHISSKSHDVYNRYLQRWALGGIVLLLMQIYGYSICALMMFTVLFLFVPSITLIVMVMFGAAGGGAYLFLRRKMDAAGIAQTKYAALESNYLLTSSRGIKEVILYQQQDRFYEKLRETIQQAVPSKVFMGFAAMIPPWLLEISGFVSVLMVMLIMIAQNASMPQIIQSFSILMLTAWRVLPSINRAMSSAVMLRGYRQSANLVLTLLEEFLRDPPNAIPELKSGLTFRKTMQFENIDFCYPESEKKALDNVSFTINKGESIGIIGPSGAGKSTLAMIVSGLISLTSGRILIDGMVMDDAMMATYRSKVGFVPQAPFLMAGKIADNVAFSQWGKKYDRERVLQACKLAAMDFIDANPKGIDIPVGENGVGLSGGQIQRVAIARALFPNPDVIIFDEATSALDQASENLIKNTIEKLHGSTTLLVIAHRLATVENCDKIIWLEKGKIVKLGETEKILMEYIERLGARAATP